MLTWFTTTFWGKVLAVVGMSMVPVIELRGGLPFGVAQGLPLWVAFVASVIGNMIPVPFILLFIRRIFEWLKKSKRLRSLIEKLEVHADKKGDVVRRYKIIGLFILVAIPLPGTGAWTGALVAGVLNMRLRDALPAIAAGVVAAGIIVSIVTYGAASLFCAA